VYVLFFFIIIYLQHVPLQIAILHAWNDLRTRFTLYKFPSYFRLINMAVCVLFFFTYSRVWDVLVYIKFLCFIVLHCLWL